MSIKDELRPFQSQMQNFGIWYSKLVLNKPANLKEFFSYDLEITLGILLKWLYEEHDIVIQATNSFYGIYHKDDAKMINIESKYRHGRIALGERFIGQDLFANYKEAIVIAISMLNNTKTPF